MNVYSEDGASSADRCAAGTAAQAAVRGRRKALALPSVDTRRADLGLSGSLPTNGSRSAVRQTRSIFRPLTTTAPDYGAPLAGSVAVLRASAEGGPGLPPGRLPFVTPRSSALGEPVRSRVPTGPLPWALRSLGRSPGLDAGSPQVSSPPLTRLAGGHGCFFFHGLISDPSRPAHTATRPNNWPGL